MTEPDFIKYPEIPHLAEALEILDGESLQVFEKLDGGNSQVRKYRGRVFCGSRANFLKRERDFRFKWFRDFHKWAMSNESFHKLPENLITYGEFLSPHTLTYKPEFVNRFFLIDLYDIGAKRFVPYDEARHMLEDSLQIQGVSFLDSLARGEIDFDLLKTLATQESKYSRYGREGVVVKDYDNQRFAKLWRTSVHRTREGLLEEITKTIASIKEQSSLPRNPVNHDTLPNSPYVSAEDYLAGRSRPNQLKRKPMQEYEGFAGQVYDELLRSGRIDVSLAEIARAIRTVTNKI